MIDERVSHDDAPQAVYGAALADGFKRWNVHWRAAYYDGDWTAEEIDAGLAGAPSEIREADGNLLVNSGIQLLEDLLMGAGGTAFNNANSYLGVGDSTTTAAASQTDLLGTNKFRKAMDSTFPSRSGQTITFRATYATSEANFSIQEQGTFNASSGGVMLNRKVTDLGTKTSASTLQLTMTITIS